MGSLAEILLFILDIAWFILIVHIIMSWLIGFEVLSLRQPLVAQIWDALNRLLEPIFSPIRRYIPSTGAVDFTPLVVFVAIYALRIIIGNNMM
ncbi:MAG: YggT family protein [Paracoccaceae bacterium]|nr:YggT family protein [Paracoccaceae bacterium]MDE2913376.1 YggT family protein [Paracoccaceae bacterium]